MSFDPMKYHALKTDPRTIPGIAKAMRAIGREVLTNAEIHRDFSENNSEKYVHVYLKHDGEVFPYAFPESDVKLFAKVKPLLAKIDGLRKAMAKQSIGDSKGSIEEVLFAIEGSLREVVWEPLMEVYSHAEHNGPLNTTDIVSWIDPARAGKYKEQLDELADEIEFTNPIDPDVIKPVKLPTPTELAKRMGVQPRTLRRWCKGISTRKAGNHGPYTISELKRMYLSDKWPDDRKKLLFHSLKEFGVMDNSEKWIASKR